jgi:hypothetical protein
VWLFGVFVCPDTLNFECSTSSNKGSNWFIFPAYLAIHSAHGVCNMILHPFEQFQPMRLKLSNSNSFIIFLFPLFYFLVSFMLFRWRTSVTCKKFLHFIWKKVREMQTPFQNWLQVSTENITTAVNNIVCLIVGKNVHFFQYIIAIPKIKWNKIRRIILVLPFKKMKEFHKSYAIPCCFSN